MVFCSSLKCLYVISLVHTLISQILPCIGHDHDGKYLTNKSQSEGQFSQLVSPSSQSHEDRECQSHEDRTTWTMVVMMENDLPNDFAHLDLINLEPKTSWWNTCDMRTRRSGCLEESHTPKWRLIIMFFSKASYLVGKIPPIFGTNPWPSTWAGQSQHSRPSSFKLPAHCACAIPKAVTTKEIPHCAMPKCLAFPIPDSRISWSRMPMLSLPKFQRILPAFGCHGAMVPWSWSKHWKHQRAFRCYTVLHMCY